MRKSPLNYLLALAISAVLVALIAVLMGNMISDSLDLGETTVDSFLLTWRLVVLFCSVLTLFSTWYWFYYGNKPSAATNTKGALTMWNIMFLIEIFLAAAAFVFMLFMFHGPFFVYLIFVLVSVSSTFVSFWVYTLMMSPRNVMYIPLGMR